jgi:diguanylate cyclase (GGDEF)-like protein
VQLSAVRLGQTGRPARQEQTRQEPPYWYLGLLLALVIPATLIEKWSGSLWMPGFGLGFAILVLYGSRWLRALLTAAVVLAVILVATPALLPGSSVGQFFTTIEGVTALAVGYGLTALGIRACNIDLSLRRLRDALLLSALGLAGAGLTAMVFMGVLAGREQLTGRRFSDVLAFVAAGGASGAFGLAPLLLVAGAWISRRSKWDLHPTRAIFNPTRWTLATWARTAETAAQLVTFAAIAAVLIGRPPHTPVYYPLLIPIGWVALRSGVTGTAIGIAIGTLIVAAVAHSHGWAGTDIDGLQTFLVVFAIAGLCFGAAQTERHDALHALERSQQALFRSATQDNLTGLATQAHLVDSARAALERAGHTGKALGVIFVDLDNFKEFNDRWNQHAVGDRVLAVIGDRLRGTLRASDTAGRYGGDEFVVICEDLSSDEDLWAIARRVEAAIREPILIGGAPYSVSASVGVEMGRPGDTAASLLARADGAMYEEKHRRRGQRADRAG